ncbi:hypothetical protein [Stutzerimonas kunmingensis]|uniref:hypothetical protein n=1 Tax=Stutzerimonas kunmingensis TaxID=1211807 RepID=UPI0028A705A0|nr:hypothetical protein [Stutzerimonas kunmingensis]
MKHVRFLALLISLTLTISAHASAYTISLNDDGVAEIYTADMDAGTLTIKQGTKTTIIADIVGYAGQTARTLVRFNGGPALSYENSGSNIHFEVFYTLKVKDNIPLIDCIYSNIRNGQNGASIRKAVCLKKILSSDYQDTAFRYTDAWIEESNRASLQSVMAEPAEAAVTSLGKLGNVLVALRYDSIEDLMSATPKTIASVAGKTYVVTIGNAYLVYDVDGATASALDVETDPIAHSLKRLTATELLQAIKKN